jgi:hypothetical protein
VITLIIQSKFVFHRCHNISVNGGFDKSLFTPLLLSFFDGILIQVSINSAYKH